MSKWPYGINFIQRLEFSLVVLHISVNAVLIINCLVYWLKDYTRITVTVVFEESSSVIDLLHTILVDKALWKDLFLGAGLSGFCSSI